MELKKTGSACHLRQNSYFTPGKGCTGILSPLSLIVQGVTLCKDPERWWSHQKDCLKSICVIWSNTYHTGCQAVRSQMTGKPGVFQSMVSQRVEHNLATEQQQNRLRGGIHGWSKNKQDKKKHVFPHSGILLTISGHPDPEKQVASVVSDSVRPHRRQPTRLHRPWDSPGKNTGVGFGCKFGQTLAGAVGWVPLKAKLQRLKNTWVPSRGTIHRAGF